MGISPLRSNRYPWATPKVNTGTSNPSSLGGAVSNTPPAYTYNYTRTDKNNLLYPEGTWLATRNGTVRGGQGYGSAVASAEPMKQIALPYSMNPADNNPWSFKGTVGSDSARQGTFNMGIGQGGGNAVQTSFRQGQFFDPRTAFDVPNSNVSMAMESRNPQMDLLRRIAQFKNKYMMQRGY